MHVAVVIRTKNEGKTLQQVLERVSAQRYRDFSTIIVDSGSTDDTLAIAGDFPTKIIHLDPQRFSYGRALNLGAEAADAEVIVFLSGHALPFDRSWLSNLVAPFSDDLVVGVTGKQLPLEDCNPFDRRGLLRRFGTEQEDVPTNSGIHFSNANGALRKAIWQEIPFDEELPFSEDLDWEKRAGQAGRRLVYAPNAVVRHSHNDSPAELGLRMYKQAQARTALSFETEKYRLNWLLVDFIAGTVYDVYWLLRNQKPFKWIIRAPARRWWINIGRFFGSRGRKWPGQPIRQIPGDMKVR